MLLTQLIGFPNLVKLIANVIVAVPIYTATFYLLSDDWPTTWRMCPRLNDGSGDFNFQRIVFKLLLGYKLLGVLVLHFAS